AGAGDVALDAAGAGSAAQAAPPRANRKIVDRTNASSKTGCREPPRPAGRGCLEFIGIVLDVDLHARAGSRKGAGLKSVTPAPASETRNGVPAEARLRSMLDR